MNEYSGLINILGCMKKWSHNNVILGRSILRRQSLVVSIFVFFFLSLNGLSGQAEKTWDLFKAATFRDVEVEEFMALASILNPDPQIMKHDNTEITIKGYHIPVMEDGLIILSKYPNANCFFCGGAGMESIMEVRLVDKEHRHFEMDEKLTFKGKLKINTTEWEFVSLILEDAILIE